MSLRNRLVMSPMETMYGTPDGLPSERTRDYFAARAKGGVGLITVGATGIDHHHPETPGGLHLGTDAAVEAHRALVEAVHEHGAKIQPQIVHAGPDGLGPEMHGVTSIGPSVIPSYLTGRPSAEVTHDQLIEVFDLFKAAVRRAAEAGYDGIELHAAHGYMFLGSFLAPQRNRRTDDYRGDSVKGRIRVVLEALAAIRSEIGDALPITLRISGYERVAGGRPMFETAQVAPQLVAAGVDAFHVSGGVIDRLVTGMVNAADDGDALNVGAAAAVKQAVDVPVIAVGRIHDPKHAEQILADGRADFIAMGRPMLADPELLLKVGAGQRRAHPQVHLVRKLHRRNGTAVLGRLRGQPAHRQGTRTRRAPAPRSRKKVVVIGSGPAGMEAARVAAERGHHVTLFERDTQTGGALLWASILHPENEPFLRWLRDEVGRSDGEDRTGPRAFGRRRGGHAARRGGGGQWRPGGAADHPRFRPAACADRAGVGSGSAAGAALVRPRPSDGVEGVDAAWPSRRHRRCRPGGAGTCRIPRRPRPAGVGAGTRKDNRARAGQQTQDRTHGPTRPAGGDGARACGRRARSWQAASSSPRSGAPVASWPRTASSWREPWNRTPSCTRSSSRPYPTSPCTRRATAPGSG